tara:strand:- start:6024 stop:6731 length:708 start_codon:yes stop_codon:yes gene_type:complete
MTHNLVINPKSKLGNGINAVMFTKTYFKEHAPDYEELPLEKILASELGLPIIWLEQVHGTRVKEVFKKRPNLIKACDGLYTNKKNIGLAVKTADCLPLVISSRDGKELSVLHVGWRGLHQGIVENSISNFKCTKKNLIAWLAPCISSKNYEVGEDVYSLFVSEDNESISSFVTTSQDNKWLFSLKEESTRRLRKFGVKVISESFCTFEDEDSFYSYRKNFCSGRMVTLAWRSDEK